MADFETIEASHRDRSRRHPQSSPETTSEYDAVGAKILIVDDEAQFRRALRAALHSCGFQIVDVASGEEALRKFEGAVPDLILLDLNMPGLTGLETCRAIREFSCVPIVILSVRSSEKDKSDAFRAGASDYLAKPFSIRELLSRIRLALPD